MQRIRGIHSSRLHSNASPKKALNRLHRNSVEKNAAMRALGVTLIEHGDDFQEAREHAMHLAQQRGAHMVPSFHTDLLRGVSTYWWEFLRAVPQLLLGLGRLLFGGHIDRRAPGHQSRQGQREFQGACGPCEQGVTAGFA